MEYCNKVPSSHLSYFVVCCLTFENSKQINLLQIGSNWIKKYQDESDWFKADKIGSNWFKLDQVRSNWIKPNQIHKSKSVQICSY